MYDIYEYSYVQIPYNLLSPCFPHFSTWTLFWSSVGRLYDVTGNYTVSFYVAGSVVMISVLMVTSLEVHRTWTTLVLPQTSRTNGSLMSTEDMESFDNEKDMEWTDSSEHFIMHESSV